MGEPKTIRWGILATGGIAETFSRDLTVDPKTRDVHKIKHKIVAAASSSSADRAAQFLKKVGAPEDAKGYGNYKDLANDPNVDIIYIATPHSHHYQNARLCLEAGKNVLCEKAFTTNAAQTRILIDIAKKKDLFLMEAVWTRYFPVSIYIRDLVTSGRLGNVTRVFADLSTSTHPEETYKDGKHRMINPDLAGGALLDLGIYSLTWVFQTLYHTQDPKTRQPPTIQSSLKQYSSGADEMTTILLTFPRPADKGGDAHGIATTSIRAATDPDGKGSGGPAVRVQGDKGEVQVLPPPFRATKARLILHDGTVEDKIWDPPGPGEGSGWYNGFGGDHGFGGSMNKEGEGHGMFWEADEAALALVEGRKEGRFEGLQESLLIMETMDEIRRQGGLKYPPQIESTDYPLDF